VDAADARPEDIAGSERVPDAVGDDVDLSLEHHVRLFERMVVGVSNRARLVADHEHRLELGVESLVNEHLDGDAAVGEGGGRHARRDRRRVDGRTTLQPVDVHVVRPEQEQVAVPRVANVERKRLRVGRRPDEERVGWLAGTTWTGRRHLDPASPALTAPRVCRADGQRTAGTWFQLHRCILEIEDGLAVEHVERRLEGVQMRIHVPVRELDQRQTGVRRAVVSAE
jgi:hypothetical protein